MIKCFSYDFNGTSVDESGEDIGIIQVRKKTTSSSIVVLQEPNQIYPN